MNALVPLLQTVADCELRIENAEETEAAINRALTYGCGMAHGYYLAGNVSKFEYQAACDRLRGVAQQRLAMHELRTAALAEGIGL